MWNCRNEFLRSLEPHDLELLRPHFTPVTLVYGDTLAEADSPITKIYFPHSGLISVVVPVEKGPGIGVALAGQSGLLGASAGFGFPVHLNTAIVQMPGSAWTLPPDKFAEVLSGSGTIRNLAFRHIQFVLTQAQQSAACNAIHNIPERVSTWLLRIRDAAGQNELNVTQEFLAEMLGVQRPSVSLVAADLQNKGLIHYRRGKLQIQNLDGLRQSACECYHTVRVQSERQYQFELKSSASA